MGNIPDTKVEIAFNAGYSTPTASRTWTDVSSYVEADQNITIVYGRSDEFGVADANQVTLTLDNKDGRFTAARAASPYFPNVKIGRPIRVTTTPPGGVASTRFIGYIDEWPVEWNGTDAYAKAVVVAHSRIARIGFDAELNSIIGEEYLQDNPLAYYTLGEPAEAGAASDSSSRSGPLLTPTGSGAAVVFGNATGPGTDSLTAAEFTAGGKKLQGVLPSPPSMTAATMEFFVTGTTMPQVELGSAYGPVLLPSFEIGTVSGEYGNVTDTSGTNAFVTFPTFGDGLTHHVAVTVSWSAGTTTVKGYFDGVLVSTGTSAFLIPVPFSPRLSIGSVVAGAVTGTTAIAHVAVYDSVLSPARIAAHAAAGLTGFVGESASDRITRYARYAGIDSSEVVADAGTNPVDGYDTTGHTAIDAMRAVEESEDGVLHDGRDNTLIFKGRAARYSVTSAFTLDATLQQIEADVAPKLDRTGLVNDATITASDGSSARGTNTASIADYGSAKATGNVLASNDIALQAAFWRVNTYGDPQPRIPALGVNFIALYSDPVLQAAILAADIGTRFTSASLPTQAQAASLDFFIEGYTETIGRASHAFVFNISPTLGFDVWICEDGVFGAFDEYPIAY